MSIANTELVLYGSTSRPTDDASAAGGAKDAAARPLDTAPTATEILTVVSSAAGDTTQTLNVTGRDGSGAIVTDAIALNGTTPANGTQVFERILHMSLSAAAAGTVTVSNATTGTLHTFAVGETDAYIHFQEAASAASSTVRYEKDFWENTNGTLTLNSAEITLTADPSAVIQIAVASAKDDSESVADRTTAPAAVGAFTDDGVAISVPGGALGPGEAIGVWAQLSLAADAAAAKTTFTTQLAGTSV